MSAPVESTPVRRSRQRAARPSRWRRLLSSRDYVIWISGIVLAFLILLAAFGPFLTSTNPNEPHLLLAYAGPMPGHPLGLDATGRDLLARLMFGGRSAVFGSMAVVLISTVLGVAIAVLAAWRGGWLDAFIARVVDALFAFPGILFAVIGTALFGVGLSPIVVTLCIAYIPFIARYARTAALTERSLPYIAALTVQGVSPLRICVRHIVPNIRRVITAQMTLAFGAAFLDLAALSFIGLGVQAPTADWGRMISDGLAGVVQGKPAQALYGGALVALTVLAANLLGDRLDTRGPAVR